MERHVIVVSVDAMVYEDIETLSKLSAFRDLWSRTARVNRVRSVYPTITYPCHSTMQTGLYPDKHGILNNEQPIMCEKSSLWQHMRNMVHGKNIFDYAKEKGLIVIGDELTQVDGELLLSIVQKRVHDCVNPLICNELVIELDSMPENPVLMGAAAIAAQQVLSDPGKLMDMPEEK